MVTMPEFVEAINSNRVIEAFGSGTACMICPIDSILYEDEVSVQLSTGECRLVTKVV